MLKFNVKANRNGRHEDTAYYCRLLEKSTGDLEDRDEYTWEKILLYTMCVYNNGSYDYLCTS